MSCVCSDCDFAARLHVLRVRALGDVDVLVAQQVGGADGCLRIVGNLIEKLVLDYSYRSRTVLFGSREPERLTFVIWPTENSVQPHRCVFGHSRRIVHESTQIEFAFEQVTLPVRRKISTAAISMASVATIPTFSCAQ